MAVNAKEIQHSKMQFARVFKWILTDDETGESIEVPEYADVSVQAHGNFAGGAVVTVEGNLIVDGSIDKYFPAKNDVGATVSLTQDGGEFIVQNFYRMRPKVTGGSSSRINIFMLLKL